MTLIERTLVVLAIGGGAYLLLGSGIIGWERSETTVYPVRCVPSFGELLGTPKCRTEERYTYLVDADAGEVRIKAENPEDFVTREGCVVGSIDDWACPAQTLTVLEGRPAILGPILCTAEQIRSGACPNIEESMVEDFGAVHDVIPRLVVRDGRPLRAGADCLMSRHYVGALRWYLTKAAEVAGGISLWPSRPEACTPAGF